MSNRKRRDRVVVFRVTDDEHERLQRACDRDQARNLSDYARTIVLRDLEADDSKAISREVARLEERISDLESMIERAARLPVRAVER